MYTIASLVNDRDTTVDCTPLSSKGKTDIIQRHCICTFFNVAKTHVHRHHLISRDRNQNVVLVADTDHHGRFTIYSLIECTSSYGSSTTTSTRKCPNPMPSVSSQSRFGDFYTTPHRSISYMVQKIGQMTSRYRSYPYSSRTNLSCECQ